MSRRLQARCVHLDEYLGSVADPGLEFDLGSALKMLSAGALCSRLIQLGENALPHIQALMQPAPITGHACVIEGERIHPLLVERAAQSNAAVGCFIIEAEADALYRTLMNRSKRFVALPRELRWKVVEMDCLYGQWLLAEAEQRRLPWVPSRPWESLDQRIWEHLRNLVLL